MPRRGSAILHGGWLLAAVVAVPFVLRLVPVSSLAALLVFTGAKLLLQDVRSLRERGGRFELVVFFLTILGIVATDLLKGVLFGLALAIGKILWMFTHLRIRFERDPDAKKTTMWLEGSATFLRLPELTAALSSIPSDHDVQVHFLFLNHVDHASFDALASWEKQHMARGGRVQLNWLDVEFLGKRPSMLRSEPPPAAASRVSTSLEKGPDVASSTDVP